ncbi:MAG TPA: glycoside hydrolase family 3 C-terminal domain-containing protein [Gammaproteobacteria bacterium]
MKTSPVTAAALTLTLTAALIIASNAQAVQYPFQNPDLDTEARIDNLLSLMTLDEKVQALSTDPSVPRLGVEGTKHVEGLHGLALGGPSNWGSKDPVPTTIFPQAYGLGESWDVDAVKTVAAIEGYEARYYFQKHKRGGLVVRAPNADIARDPRWGRTEESYGEDAWFNGTMTVAFIQGLQGDDPDYWQTAALMKHFLANSNEDNRDSSSSDFDERLLHEYYALPFRMGIVEGGSRAFMTAYNAVNGVPMIVHPMLETLAVKQWGQTGIICTDGGAFRLLLEAHKYYPDPYKAANAVIKTGTNQFLDDYKEGVYGALANGYLTEKEIEDVLRGVYRVMIKLGQLDPKERVRYKSIGVEDEQEPWLTESHKQAAREVTRKTIVLLKNENGTLPLNREKMKSVAVIGSVANDVFLDWYSGTPPYTVTALEGIRNTLGKDVDVRYAKDNIDGAATGIAKDADAVILVVGNHPYCNGAEWKECGTPSFGREAVDRKSLTLEEEALIKQVYAVNRNVVVVLASSFPYAINWTQKHIPAILHMAHNSQEMGNALADVLFGDYNPAGRLTQTWVASLKQLPDMMDYNIRNGRTYMYFDGKPLYPFGYGLSYTQFDYSNLTVSSDKLKRDGEITVRVDIKNTGEVAGDEVVQLYVKHRNSKVKRPDREIRGFKRVSIPAGKTVTVSIPLIASDLAYWDAKMNRFVVEKKMLQLMVGASSKDIRLTKNIQVVE